MGGSLVDIINNLSYGLLEAAGQSPFAAIGFILTHGGLIVLFPILVHMLWTVWMFYIWTEYTSGWKWVLLAVDVPRETEQTMRAVETIMASLHGVYYRGNKIDRFWTGVMPDYFSLEIVSIDGYIQYFVQTLDYNVDLVKGAIYAQYPDAEIIEVEDYTTNTPSKFPDEDYELWGTEFVLKRPDVYPIKTYEYFEHSLTGQYADPMASILELLSRLKPGEQVWLQLVVTPKTGGDFRAAAVAEVDSLIGKTPAQSYGPIDRLYFNVIHGLQRASNASMFAWEEQAELSQFEAAEGNEDGNFMGMTTGDRIVVEEVQKKSAQLVFDTKFRFIYLAKKEVWDHWRVINNVYGAIKQFNTLDLNAFSHGRYTYTSKPAYLFRDYRRNIRKTRLINNYKYRSNWGGENAMTMSQRELATLWHFPGINVQAPLLAKSASRTAEPPSVLPQQSSPFTAIRSGAPEPPANEPPADAPETAIGEDPQAVAPLTPAQPQGQRIPVRPEGSPEPASFRNQGQLHSMPGLPPGVKPVENPVSPAGPSGYAAPVQTAQPAQPVEQMQQPVQATPQPPRPVQRPQAMPQQAQQPAMPPQQPVQQQQPPSRSSGGAPPTNLPI